MNTRLLFYRRLASPLHATRAGVGAIWALALTAAALILYNPLPLAALALAVLGAGACAGVGRQLAGTLRTALIVGLPIVAINVLASREGLTVFARLGDLGPFGQGDLTVEAVVYGAVIALKVTLLMLITTLASLGVDPDELLRGFRRFSFRSALTASLATRMIPVLSADAGRLAEAQRTRPEDPAQGVRGRVALLSAIVGGSLERAMEVAATLELRGFAIAAEDRSLSRRWLRLRGPRGSGARMPGPRAGRPNTHGSARRVGRPWSRHDFAFLGSALAVLALVLAGRLSGAASFEAYPLVKMQVGAGTFVLCAALVAAVLLPFVDRRGIDQ
jgi:energy-coupling factor transport system permease protein